MSRARRIVETASDGSERALGELVSRFTVKRAVDWLRVKFAAFDTSHGEALACDATKNEKDYFEKAELLGYITRLPNDEDRPLLVAAIKMRRDMTERTSRLVQFNYAKKLIQNAVARGAQGVTGLPSQGLFFFYDKDGYFRLSLVTGEVERRKFKYNEAKRQSFYVEPRAANNIVRRRLTPPIRSFAELKDVFSAQLLTKQFYREIQNWYFWALRADQHVSFPNALDDNTDAEKFNKENLIRLVTRLVFTWFMKAKGLVNENLFKPDFLASALKHFDPEGAVDNPAAKDADKHCTYYRAVLQNLFFATFNQEISDRGFVDKRVLDAKRYNIKNYYRNAKLFTETDESKIIAYFNGSPFVNGGLFECLDNVEQFDKESGKTHVYSWDGFSNNLRFKDGPFKGVLKSALIPDRLFFGAERMVDLSECFEKDKASKTVNVRGIVNILNDYVFTIEENTPLDEDVALDPELLGNVFENLLGCYNPETQQLARNATGSFYTPREIVNYMVCVSLAAYLKRTCPRIVPAEIDALVEGRAELDAMPSVKEGAQELLKALFKAKILDPACGSGAFPMGALAVIVEILRTIDPDNRHWFKIVLEESLKEAESVADVGDEKERAELKAQIEYDFQNRVDFPDYARKLYVIEHCIFGSDIQPIAVQICRLRFFITLLCEQAKTDDPAKNYGITPLPNLENNFVAANSLLSVDIGGMREILRPRKIGDARTKEGKTEKLYEDRKVELIGKINQLRAVRHQLFLPKTSDKKKALKIKDEKLRQQIEGLTVALYDTRMKEQLAFLEEQLDTAKHALKTKSDAELNKSESTVQDAWFGVATTTKATKTLREKLQTQIASSESRIAEIKSDSSKKQLLNDVTRLIKWNPFAFNVAETFLDPEWMFGVKDGFDIIIANPPYIKEYENRKAFDGFREQSPYYIGKMDLWYGFACKGIDALKEGGILCFIAQNNWTTSAGASKMREKVMSDSRIVKMVDFNDYMIFESADIQTMVMLFSRNAEVDDYQMEYWRLDNGATRDDMIDLICHKSESKCMHLLPTIHRDSYAGKLLTFSSSDAKLFDKISSGKLYLNKKEIIQGIVPALDDYFLLSSRAGFTDEEQKYIKEFHTGLQDRYVGYPVEKYLIYLSAKNFKRPDLSSCPNLLSHFEPHKDELKAAKIKYGTPNKPYYFVHRERDESFFMAGNEKIVSQIRCDHPRFYYTKDPFYGSRALFLIRSSRWNMRFLVGLLNSKLIEFWLYNKGKMQGAQFKVDKDPLLQIPLVKPESDAQDEVVQKVDRILAAKKKDPEADTTALEAEIDQLVYKLYGLTEEEIAIVEGREEKVKVKGEGEEREVMRRGRARGSAAVGGATALPDDDEELE